MRFVYSISEKRVHSPENFSDTKLPRDVLSHFPQGNSEYPICVLASSSDNTCLFKAYSDEKYGELCVFSTSPESTECVFELIETEDRERPMGKGGSADIILSRAALRTALKRLYSGKSACIALPDTHASDLKNGVNILSQIYRYLDLGTEVSIISVVNFAGELGEKKGIFILPESKIPSETDSFRFDHAYSVNNNTDLDAFADYLIDSDIENRRRLLSLISKYKSGCPKTDILPEIQVYKAFIEGDEELLFDIVHSYCVETSKKGETPIIEQGVAALLRQNIRDRAVLKLIYDGYETRGFEELLAKNAGDIAFCSAFREVGDLLKGDNAESYNIMLASYVTNKADDDEEQDRYNLIKAELESTEKLLSAARNAIECAMIDAYKKVLLTLEKRAEDITNTESDALIQTLVMKEDDISSDDEVAEDNAPLSNRFYEKARSLHLMTRDNYLDVYYELFGSDYLNDLMGLEEENDEEELLRELYKDRLSELFRSYEDYKNVILGCDRLKENPPLKMLAEIRYSDTLCIALEDSDAKGILSVILGFDPKKTDCRVFYSLLYKKLLEIAESEGSCSFIDTLRKKNTDSTIDALLLAAKVKMSFENNTPTFVDDVNKLADVFGMIQEYVGYDICFDITLDGKEYLGISLIMYIWAKNGENSERVKAFAERYGDFNDFLAQMGVKGYEIKKPISQSEPVVSDVKSESTKSASDNYDVIFLEDVGNSSPSEERPELMKIAIAVLSFLTLLAIILFILFLGQ